MKSKQITIGAGLSYLSIGINLLFAFFYTPWMIQQIGQSDYALYTLANSIIALFLFDFGLSSATSKYISNYIAQGRQDEADEFMGAICQLYVAIDVFLFLVFFILFFFLDAVYVNLTAAELAKFKIVYCIAAMYSILNFPFVTLNGVLTSYEKFISLKLADILYRFLCVGLTVYALARGLGLYALVAANAVSGLCIVAYKLVVIKRTTPIRLRKAKKDSSFYKMLFSFSAWTTITSLAYRLVFNITPSILGIVANSEAIAVFGIVTVIEQYVFMISTAINGMFLPKISRIYANCDADNDIMPLMIKVGRFQFALNCLMIIGFWAVGKQFVQLWLGSGYEDVYLGVLLVIIPGAFYNSLQIANTAMIVRDKVKYQALIMLATGIVNVLFSVVLSNYMGAIGACLSIFIAYTCRAILYHIVHEKMMELDMRRFAKECYSRMIVPAILSLFAGYGINRLISSSGWMLLVARSMILISFFLAAAFFSYLTHDERNRIFGIRE